MVEKPFNRRGIAEEFAERNRLDSALGQVVLDRIFPGGLPAFHLERYDLHGLAGASKEMPLKVRALAKNQQEVGERAMRRIDSPPSCVNLKQG
jgi:hypothetical protein